MRSGRSRRPEQQLTPCIPADGQRALHPYAFSGALLHRRIPFFDKMPVFPRRSERKCIIFPPRASWPIPLPRRRVPFRFRNRAGLLRHEGLSGQDIGVCCRTGRLQRRQPLEGTAAERRIYKAAGRYCIFQAGDQEVIIAFCPIINKRRVLDHPSAVLFPPAFCDGLMPDKILK